MNRFGDTARIAVIGLGPRGLGALEALAEGCPAGIGPIRVDVFDPFPAPGAGPNFAPDESPLCLLNIPIRDIAIRPPGYSRCGDFADWLAQDAEPDTFPTRADLGRYLQIRLGELLAHEALSITLIPEPVEGLTRAPDGWRVQAKGARPAPYDEVLLTPGQPAVTPDQQWAGWQDHAAHSMAEVHQAYPATRLIEAAGGWNGKTVGIRGMGLSAYDVLRCLTTAQGGVFRDGRYIPSGREPARIVPFSLDGKPPFPKPETEALDARFTPLEAETLAFSMAIAEAAEAAPDSARQRVTEALAPVVARILAETGATKEACHVADWLQTEWNAPGTQETRGSLDMLHHGIALAEGAEPPTIGYVVGQVWRKWQDQIRAGFNPAQTSPETARLLIGFDEGLKRYSYGPPVSSAREMAALVEAGLADLDLATDPEIEMCDAGWRLESKGRRTEVSVMIDAVLPSPDLAAVKDPLISDLVSKGHLTAAGDDLAASINPEGQAIGRDGSVRDGLCLLGRLALGSVIAVDSLHDCFGEASRRWAQGVLRRLG
ncbi:FAD/NAD(P)-binding protein [Tropicimonas sediminicola]|uniref:FAD/NAD(P)-binding protein n=1 Tax=Tropicimonas sediminicola TaxID=1031541 RepID=UPI0015954433|nr:FAD/NAD(P)-binding domain-containing protein [Tropicimonas sediminicola]